jgi:hypothetical protein
VFLNKGRNKVKLLHWESGGFVLYYKRLEEGTMDWPFCKDGCTSKSVTYTQMLLMLEGITIKSFTQRKRYKKHQEIVA